MKKALGLLGLLLFAIIILSIDLTQTTFFLLQANPFLLLAAFALMLFSAIPRSIKWIIFLSKTGIKTSFCQAIQYYYIGIFFGAISPGRIGDFTKAFFFKEKGIGKAIATVLTERLADLTVLFSLSIIACIYFSFYFSAQLFYLALATALLFSFCMLFFFNEKILRKFLKKTVFFLVPEKFKPKIKKEFISFLSTTYSLSKSKEMLLALLLSFLSWTMVITSSYLIALSLNLFIPFHFIFFALPISLLVMLLPISISGIGTRDAAIIFLFSFIAIKPEESFAFSVLFFLLMLASALPGALFLANPGIKFKIPAV